MEAASSAALSSPHPPQNGPAGVPQNNQRATLQAMMAGMTKEKLQHLIQRLQDLAASGCNESNNDEAARISSFLRYFQQAQSLRQQHRAQNPPAQRSPSQPTQPAGSTPQPPSSSDTPSSAVAPFASQQQPFSVAQQALVRCQQTSYRYLSRNLPVPHDLQTALSDPQKALDYVSRLDAVSNESTGDPSPSKEPPSKMPPVSPIHAAPSASPNDDPVYPYTSFQTPLQVLKDASSDGQFSRSVVMPTLLPSGIDPYVYQEERDRLIEARVSQRIKQLGDMPNNLASEPPPSLFPDVIDDHESDSRRDSAQKIKALVEHKSLRLLNRQKQLREQVLKGYSSAQALQLVEDRNAYRRFRRPHLRDARTTEQLEREQKRSRELRAKAKQLEHLGSIIQHGQSLVMAHRVHSVHAQKLAKGVQRLHIEAEKEEQKRVERVSKERIKALRNDDEEGYLKLLDTAKDGRIHHLLKQTDVYLDSLAEAVRQQQTDRSFVESGTGDDVDESAFGAAPVFEEEAEQKVDYYNVAHKIKETITEQPSIMIGGKLKEYQLKGLQWMISLFNNRLNGILADEMGLGKTIQTISLITYLIEKKKQDGPYLVVVPLSTIPNWVMEFERWAPTVKVVTYKGGPAARKATQATMMRHGSYQVLLTTYEYIIKDRPFLSKTKWLHMVIDEGHRMKNSQSKLSQTLQHYYYSRYRIILTGTPLQNNLPELWALLNFVLPKVFNSVKSFDEWFNTPFANTGGTDRIELNEEEELLIIRRLHKVLRPFLLRRLKKDVEGELPDKVERVLKCRLSGLQSQLYKQIKDHGMVLTEGGVDSRGKQGGIRGLSNIVMQLRKICNHPYVFDGVENAVVNHIGLQWTTILTGSEKDALLGRVAGKFELLDRMLPKLLASNHRVLIFFQMTRIMDIMVDFLEHKGIKTLRLDGGTKHEDRAGLLSAFNDIDSDFNIFLLSTRAGGLGLNLQTADTVVIFDSDWNPHQDLQAQDRAHRIGQKKEVRILRLVTTQSIEEHILARARGKVEIDKKVIQGGRFDNKSTQEEREEYLKSLLESNVDDDEDQNGDIDDSELNDILARSERETVLFAQMDEERKRADRENWIKTGRPGPVPSRLIEEKELPDVYRLEQVTPPDETDKTEDLVGRRRNKGPVYYDDGLKENEFIAILEDDDTDLKEEVERRRANKEKRAAAKLNRVAAASNMDSPRTADVSEDDSFSSVQGSKRKRLGRPNKTETSSRMPSVDGPMNGDDEEPSRPTKKRKGVSNTTKERLKEMFLKAYEAIEGVTNEEHGYQSCGIFIDLPSKRDYPTYYVIIKKPISMKQIKKKISQKAYKSVDDFKADWYLMFDNARTFNDEASPIYDDANTLQRALDDKLAELEAESINDMSRSMSPSISVGGGRGRGRPSNNSRSNVIADSDSEDNNDGGAYGNGDHQPMSLKLTLGGERKII